MAALPCSLALHGSQRRGGGASRLGAARPRAAGWRRHRARAAERAQHLTAAKRPAEQSRLTAAPFWCPAASLGGQGWSRCWQKGPTAAAGFRVSPQSRTIMSLDYGHRKDSHATGMPKQEFRHVAWAWLGAHSSNPMLPRCLGGAAFNLVTDDTRFDSQKPVHLSSQPLAVDSASGMLRWALRVLLELRSPFPWLQTPPCAPTAAACGLPTSAEGAWCAAADD